MNKLLITLTEAVLQLEDLPLLTRDKILQALEEHKEFEKNILNQLAEFKEENRKSRFVEPSIEEVTEEFKKLDCLNPQDIAARFVSFYGSKGWMVGKNKMKSWKLAAARWAMDAPKVAARMPIV